MPVEFALYKYLSENQIETLEQTLDPTEVKRYEWMNTILL